MTYSSSTFLISCGRGSLSRARSARSSSSSRMMSLQSSTHSSQTNTEGPAMSLRTSCWLFPQKEQYSSLPSSCRPRESSLIECPRETPCATQEECRAARRFYSMRSRRAATDVGSRLGGSWQWQLTALLKRLVHQAIADSVRGVHEVVPVGIDLDLLHALARVLGQYFVQPV